MRKANVNDLFEVARLVKELKLRDDLFNAQKGTEDMEKIGFDFMYDIMVKATTEEMQNRIYKCFSSPFEMEVEKVGLLGIDEFIDAFKQCFDIVTLINFTKRVNK